MWSIALDGDICDTWKDTILYIGYVTMADLMLSQNSSGYAQTIVLGPQYIFLVQMQTSAASSYYCSDISKMYVIRSTVWWN